MKTAMTSAQGNWFLLTNHPEKLYPAKFLGERWNVGDTPKVTMADLATVLLAVIADPGGKHRAFAIDPNRSVHAPGHGRSRCRTRAGLRDVRPRARIRSWTGTRTGLGRGTDRSGICGVE